MMDMKIFKGAMCFLSSVYQKFELSESQMDAWYECVKDLTDGELFQAIVREWTKSSKYPPTIADLREMYFANKKDDGWQRA